MSQNLHPPTKLRDDLEVTKALTVKAYATPDELERWKEAAASEGRSLSNWITHACNVAAAGRDPQLEHIARGVIATRKRVAIVAKPKKGKRS